MTEKPIKWLVLIHQIPPKPDALRVKIWRRLQQIGAVAIKPSVYVMPFSEQSREDLSWTRTLIVDGGGDGSISELRFLEGLSDKQVISQFQKTRGPEYEKVIEEANSLVAQWSAEGSGSQHPSPKAKARVDKLQRRFDRINAIDFFQAPGKQTARLLIQDLYARACGEAPGKGVPAKKMDRLKGKVWVTRKNLFVDRIACGWLIRRFVDENALFKYIESDPYAPVPGEIRFDMFEGEYTHEGDSCSFEVMIKRLGLKNRSLACLAEVIHDIDLKDIKYNRAEADGLNALITGLAASEPDDEKRMARGIQLMDDLYAYFHDQEKPD